MHELFFTFVDKMKENFPDTKTETLFMVFRESRLIHKLHVKAVNEGLNDSEENNINYHKDRIEELLVNTLVEYNAKLDFTDDPRAYTTRIFPKGIDLDDTMSYIGVFFE